MNASQNVGADTPIRQRKRAEWSTRPSRRTAAATPSGTPTATVSRPATVASSMVAGTYCRMASSTGRWDAIDSPMSPCVSRARKIAYCWYSGRSRPHRARKRATVSGLLDCLSPSWARIGSAGTEWATRKTTRVAATAIAAEAATRRRTYRKPIRYTASSRGRERRRSPPPPRQRCDLMPSRDLVRRLHVVEVDDPAGCGEVVPRDGLARGHAEDGLDQVDVVGLVDQHLHELTVEASRLLRIGLATCP